MLTKVPLPKRLAKSVLRTEKKEKHNYYNKEIENKYICICTRDWLSVELHYGSVLEDKLGGFWVTDHLPLPLFNINTYYALKAKLGLRGGVGGQLPRNLN